jgi:hypothetical protein
MSVRYLSAERTIAAAGAAFACPDDDFSDLARARIAASRAMGFSMTCRRLARRMLSSLGF